MKPYPLPVMHLDESSPSLPEPPTVQDIDALAADLESLIPAANAMDVLNQYAQAELFKLYSLDNWINGKEEPNPTERFIDSLPIVTEAPLPSLRPTFEYITISPSLSKMTATTSSIVHISQSWNNQIAILSSLNLVLCLPWECLSTASPEIIELPGPSSFSRVSAFHPCNQLVGLTKYDTIFLYDLIEWKTVGSFSPHKRSITGAAFSIDGVTLITSGMDGRLVTQDLIASRTVYDIKLDSYPSGLTVNENGSIVATPLATGDVLLFDSRTERAVTTIEAHNGYATTAQFGPKAFLPQANLLATAGNDRTLNLFDIRAPLKSYAKFHRHLTTPLTIAFDDRGHVWSGTRGGELQAWDLSNGMCVYKEYQITQQEPIYSLVFSESRRAMMYTSSPPCLCELKLDSVEWTVNRHQPKPLGD